MINKFNNQEGPDIDPTDLTSVIAQVGLNRLRAKREERDEKVERSFGIFDENREIVVLHRHLMSVLFEGHGYQPKECEIATDCQRKDEDILADWTSEINLEIKPQLDEASEILRSFRPNFT